MLYEGYDSYGYKESQSFKTLAVQKEIEFNEAKYDGGDVLDNESFYTENGQELTDLVIPKD